MEKILLVDDEKSFLTSMSHSLRKRGYDVDTSGGPDEALAKMVYQKREYDYLITDVELPRMLGYELADIACLTNPNIKVILISAYDFPSGYSNYSYLTKPFKVSDLVMALEKTSSRDYGRNNEAQ
jgi:CheY-like chemotaxis protein